MRLLVRDFPRGRELQRCIYRNLTCRREMHNRAAISATPTIDLIKLSRLLCKCAALYSEFKMFFTVRGILRNRYQSLMSRLKFFSDPTASCCR